MIILKTDFKKSLSCLWLGLLARELCLWRVWLELLPPGMNSCLRWWMMMGAWSCCWGVAPVGVWTELDHPWNTENMLEVLKVFTTGPTRDDLALVAVEARKRLAALWLH